MHTLSNTPPEDEDTRFNPTSKNDVLGLLTTAGEEMLITKEEFDRVLNLFPKYQPGPVQEVPQEVLAAVDGVIGKIVNKWNVVMPLASGDAPIRAADVKNFIMGDWSQVPQSIKDYIAAQRKKYQAHQEQTSAPETYQEKFFAQFNSRKAMVLAIRDPFITSQEQISKAVIKVFGETNVFFDFMEGENQVLDVRDMLLRIKKELVKIATAAIENIAYDSMSAGEGTPEETALNVQLDAINAAMENLYPGFVKGTPEFMATL